MNKKIVIFGGGTVYHVRNHLALCAPAYGSTAKQLAELSKEYLPNMDVDLRLTKMAGGNLETNDDIKNEIEKIIKDDTTKVVILSSALCDFEGQVGQEKAGKYSSRLKTDDIGNPIISLNTAEKIISLVRRERKDIFLVGFKTTCGASKDEQYIAGLNLCKKSSCNLVLANDTKTRFNMIITPEESRYCETFNRNLVLRELLTMIFHRTHLTFTRSTIIDGQPISWDSASIPNSLREVVNFCIDQNAYKPLNGVTAGHFAFKVDDNTFLTSIRKTNFNDLNKNGLVKIVTDGPDTVLAYGAKPSVGGQSQRIVFQDHKGLDCIVHFHCPKNKLSTVPSVSQKEFECGSHECGKNTSNGLREFKLPSGSIYCVYLDNHGPNIVFNHNIDPKDITNFITENFDLSQKTGGFVSIDARLNTNNVVKDFINYDTERSFS